MTYNTAHKNRVVNGGFYFGPRQEGEIGEQINALIDAALEEMVATQPPRGYLGGSRLGVECHRALAYEYHKAKADRAAYLEVQNNPPYDIGKHRTAHPFKGKAIRRFQMGHMHEDETAKWLRMAGFDLATHKPNGGQFGFGVAKDPVTGEFRMAGHIDGRIDAGPVALPYPVLWEHKIMKSKKWKECNGRGVKLAQPVYYAQLQTYMAYMELRNALFTALDTDTSALLFEVVPFVQADAQWATDRGVKVLESNRPEELPRITNDPTDWKCRWCDHKDTCWAKPETAAPQIAKPAWIGGPK